jgi:S-phase kinase-associated protein 1
MEEKTINLKTSNGVIIPMLKKHARMCFTLRNLLDETDEVKGNYILLPISEFVLTKINEFCIKYEDVPIEALESKELKSRINPLEGWDKEFVSVSPEILLEMIKGANFLELQQMVNICCNSISNKIKVQSPTEINKIFGIEGDFTQEQQSVLDANPLLEQNDSMDISIITPSESGGGSIKESIILPSF